MDLVQLPSHGRRTTLDDVIVTGRTQHVCYDRQLSSIQPVHVEVPQWSVLAPPAIRLVHSRHKSDCDASHQYADDCATMDVNDEAATVHRFFRCIADIGDWMS